MRRIRADGRRIFFNPEDDARLMNSLGKNWMDYFNCFSPRLRWLLPPVLAVTLFFDRIAFTTATSVSNPVIWRRYFPLQQRP